MSYRTVAGVAAVTQTVQGWEFLPTASVAWLHVVLAAWATGFWALVGLGLWWFEPTALAVLGLPVALFTIQLAGHGVWGWRRRARPLVVEPGGRVRYGDQELCPAGSVKAVCVVPDPCSEADGHKVRLTLSAGATVELPRPYFESFLTRDHALHFAREIARALNVGVVEPA